jgi:hypothetical protein
MQHTAFSNQYSVKIAVNLFDFKKSMDAKTMSTISTHQVDEDILSDDLYYLKFNDPAIATGIVYIPTNIIKSKLGFLGNEKVFIKANQKGSPYPFFADDDEFLRYICGHLKEILSLDQRKFAGPIKFQNMAFIKLDDITTEEKEELAKKFIRVKYTGKKHGECISILDIYLDFLKKINKLREKALSKKTCDAKEQAQPADEKQKIVEVKQEPAKKEYPELAELQALYDKMVELHQKPVANAIPREIVAEWKGIKTKIAQFMDNYKKNKCKKEQFEKLRAEYINTLKRFDEKIEAAKNPAQQKSKNKPKQSSYAQALRPVLEAKANAVAKPEVDSTALQQPAVMPTNAAGEQPMKETRDEVVAQPAVQAEPAIVVDAQPTLARLAQ